MFISGRSVFLNHRCIKFVVAKSLNIISLQFRFCKFKNDAHLHSKLPLGSHRDSRNRAIMVGRHNSALFGAADTCHTL